MYIALTFVLILLALVFHELGHALAMRKYGIRVETLGIGIPMNPKITFHPKIGKKLFGEQFSLVLSPWLLGAFVKSSGDDSDFEKKLPYQAAAHIYGAGIVANLAYASLLISIFAIMTVGDANVLTRGIIPLGISLFVAYLLIRFSRQFCAWILPLLSLAAIAVFTYSIWDSVMVHHDEKALGGIVTASIMVTDYVKDASHAILFGFAISLGLAILNALPFYPLDGGHIAQLIFRGRFEKFSIALKFAGGAIVFLLIAMSVYTDIRQVIHLFMS
ncbi:MAG: site-2 protease family protein [Candidatus Moranbacteria bacterium]|nr:site-2 protease family protein [Candidatus Moranbacteria bacterium]